MKLREEPLVRVDGVTHDYSLHFVFGLRNPSGSTRSAKVSVDWERASATNLTTGRLYRSNSHTAEFAPARTQSRPDGHTRFEWSVELAPGEESYWSNSLWRPYELVKDLFAELAPRAGLSAHVYGKSIEGRELVAYYRSDGPEEADRPCVLVTSGFHPVEGDTLGTEAMLEWLSGEGRSALGRWNVVIAPLANPDGFANGYNGCNAAGVNFFWNFRNHDRVGCPEAFHLWKLIQLTRPVVYIDLHCYSVHGARKRPGPYLKPDRFYWGQATKSVSKELVSELSRIAGTESKLVFSPSTLAYKLADEMNTVTFAKYHLHQDLGREGMKRLAVEVLTRVLDVLKRENHSTSDLLLRPYGHVSKGLHERIGRSVYRARYSYPRTVLGLVKRIVPG